MNRNLDENPVAIAKIPGGWSFTLILLFPRWNVKREKQKILFYADVRYMPLPVIKVCDPSIIIFNTQLPASIIKVAVLTIFSVGYDVNIVGN